MAYMFVLWIELSPAFLERAEQMRTSRRSSASRRVPRRSSRSALLWIIALGMLLPTMHQSSLGALMLIAGPRLHPLWNTGWLPLLFLMSCIAMGYAVVVFEAIALEPGCSSASRSARCSPASGQAIVPLGVVVRRAPALDLAGRGQLGALFALRLATAC